MSEPWVRFEDEHLLAVTKPAGVTTHRADATAQDGMHEWVQRQRREGPLSILHRLDKATSGVLLFGKTRQANQALAAQFERRQVAKRYELLATRDDRRARSLRCDTPIPGGGGGHALQPAVTELELAATGEALQRYTATPHTGRTHQVRLHAARLGMAIVGDQDHGGMAAPRVFLHAASLGFEHPTGGRIDLDAARPASFDVALQRPTAVLAADPALAALVAHEARAVLFDPGDTNAYLWIDRHHDGFPDVRVERLGDVALVHSYADPERPVPTDWLDALHATLPLDSIYEQPRPRPGGGPARRLTGADRPRFEVTELGCRYLVDLEASPTSSGIFLDQREARRQLLTSDLTGRRVLNAFGHTGALSVASAMAGAETLTLDLSKRYLDWSRENLRLNGIDPLDHDVIFGDALEWMERLARKGRTFDLVLVDPPSTSTTRGRGGKRWAVDRDLHLLVERAARLGGPHGTLFVSTNLRRMPWSRFLDHLARGLAAAGRRGAVDTRTLPLDHRSGPGDPPYLKSAWVELDVDGA